MVKIHDRRRQDYRPNDFDFYRTQVIALRSQARPDTCNFSAGLRIVMISLTTIVLSALVISMRSQAI